jgi:hypothetical protein
MAVMRLPRDRRDDRYDAQGLMPRKAAGAGWVTSVQDDTVTVEILGENVTGVIFLHDKPTPGDLVEIETRGDLTVIPRWFEHPEPLVPLDGHSQLFNPLDDGYLFPSSFDDNNVDWSVEFLFKLRANPPEARVIAQTSNGIGLNQSWHLFIEPSGQIYFLLKDMGVDVLDTVWLESGRSGAIADHKAHHIVIRYDKTAKRGSVLVDANEVCSVSHPRNYLPDRNLILGGSYFGGSSPDCIVDEVALYKKVMSTGEAADHVNAWKRGGYPEAIIGSGAYTYLRLDEPAGGSTLCWDSIQNMNNGDLQFGNTHTGTPPLQWGE